MRGSLGVRRRQRSHVRALALEKLSLQGLAAATRHEKKRLMSSQTVGRCVLRPEARALPKAAWSQTLERCARRCKGKCALLASLKHPLPPFTQPFQHANNIPLGQLSFAHKQQHIRDKAFSEVPAIKQPGARQHTRRATAKRPHACCTRDRANPIAPVFRFSGRAPAAEAKLARGSQRSRTLA